MAIQIQAPVDSPFQGLVNDKVQGTEVGELIAGYADRTTVAEEMGDPIRSHLLPDDRVAFRGVSDDTDIGTVSLVPSAAVGDRVERKWYRFTMIHLSPRTMTPSV